MWGWNDGGPRMHPNCPCPFVTSKDPVTDMFNFLKTFLNSDRGAASTEYVVIAAADDRTWLSKVQWYDRNAFLHDILPYV